MKKEIRKKYTEEIVKVGNLMYDTIGGYVSETVYYFSKGDLIRFRTDPFFRRKYLEALKNPYETKGVMLRDESGKSLLDVAIDYNDKKAFGIFLEKGALSHHVLERALFSSLREDRVDFMRALLEKGADINGSSGFYSPVFMEALKKDKDKFRFILNRPELKIDLNKFEKENGFSYCVNELDILEKMFSLGAQANSLQESPLVWCENPKAVDIFAQYGLNWDAVDKRKMSPLTQALVSERYEVAEKLLSAGASPNSFDIRLFMRDSISLKHINKSIYKDKVHQVALWIVNHGYDFGKEKKGSFLQSLIKEGLFFEDVFLKAKENGADLNVRDNNGNSLLHNALVIDGGDLDRQAAVAAVLFLSENGAEMNAVNKEGQTPLQVFLKDNFRDTAIYDDKDKEFFRNNLKHAAAYRKLLNVLLSKGADANLCQKGKTPLQLAVEKGSLDAVSSLLSAGADPDGRDCDKGETPLMSAVCHPRWENKQIAVQIAELLLKNGASVNLVDNKGKNELFNRSSDADSFQKNRQEKVMDLQVVRCLVSKGADVNLKDSSGEMPLESYVYVEDKNLTGGKTEDFARVLIEAGAEITSDHWNAFSKAVLKERSPALEKLFSDNFSLEARLSQKQEKIEKPQEVKIGPEKILLNKKKNAKG